jgi:hypothetical protein
MYRDYDTKEHCADGGIGGMFAFYTMNACIKSDDASFMFSACDSVNGLYSIVQYTDSECKDFLAAVTTRLQVCYVRINDAGL